MPDHPTTLTGAARAFSTTYLVGQSASIVMFWAALMAIPGVRAQFVPRNMPSDAHLVLALSDGVFLPLSGLLGAVSLARPGAWTLPLLWLHAGAAMYAALFALGLWLSQPTHWLVAGLMAPMLIVPITIALAAGRRPVAASRGTWKWALCRTAAQVVVFWGFFLGAVPIALVSVERSLGVPIWSEHAESRAIFASVCFAIFGGAGLYSGWLLARLGLGTPLPIDPTSRLVIAGPYAFVRNPMAITGLGQGLSVALWHGSPTILLYTLAGAVLWHIAIRPVEEEELLQKFGVQFDLYRRRVRCWIPRVRAFIASS